MDGEFLNEPVSSLTHFIGALLSIAALVFMVTIGATKGTVWHVVGFSIFGAGLILLYSASTLFHFFNRFTKTKNIFERIDHAMIYVLIAATYTPICLTILRGAWGWTILGIIWIIALVGVFLKSFGVWMKGFKSTILYIIAGWVIIIAVYPLLKTTSLHGFLWLLAGGIFYTLGALFYDLGAKHERKNKWWGFHETFHIFVLAGSFAHFWFIINYLI